MGTFLEAIRALPGDNSNPNEAALRRAWNRSMEKGLRQCSSNARSFINATISKNRKIIDELNSLQGRR